MFVSLVQSRNELFNALGEVYSWDNTICRHLREGLSAPLGDQGTKSDMLVGTHHSILVNPANGTPNSDLHFAERMS